MKTSADSDEGLKKPKKAWNGVGGLAWPLDLNNGYSTVVSR